MPMLDAHIPEGALAPAAEVALIAKLTDLLLEHEGADPRNPIVRSIAWVFVHRPAVFVAGASADAPRYKFVASVPEGQWTEEGRRSMVEAVTEAVLDAEDGAYDRDPMRVWVFPVDVTEGTWGGGGRIVGLADIAGLALGDPEKGRRHAEQRLAKRALVRRAVLSEQV